MENVTNYLQKILFLLCIIFFPQKGFTQNEDSSVIYTRTNHKPIFYCFAFKEFSDSLDLSLSDMAAYDFGAKNVLNDSIFWKKYYIILYINTTKEEHLKNPYIGYIRAKKVLDYIHRTLEAPLNNIQIMDCQDSKKDAFSWLISCQSSIEITLHNKGEAFYPK